MSCQANILARRIDFDRVVSEFPAEHLRDPVDRFGRGGEFGCHPVRPREHEADIREGDRHPADDFCNRPAFGTLALHELQTRGCGEEQIADFNHGAGIGRGRSWLAACPAIDADFVAALCSRLPADYLELGDGTYRRQRLAAEAERADIVEPAAELRGAMSTNGKGEILRRHAGTIVNDTDQRLSAACGRDLDALRTGVDRVLDQFLDDTRRTLDDFAGGNLVDERVG